MKRLALMVLLVISLGLTNQTAAQPNRRILSFKEYSRPGSINYPKQGLPKKVARKSKSKSDIVLSFEGHVPDSIQKAIYHAKSLWESKIDAPQPIFLKIKFESLDKDIVIISDVFYTAAENPSEQWKDGCPESLASQIAGRPIGTIDAPDGIITFNTDVEWNCCFSTNNLPGYNYTTMALRGIATCLGFGSSLFEIEPSKFAYTFFHPTYFDKMLKSGATYLHQLEEESDPMTNFVTSEKVVAKTKTSEYNVYAPKVYKPFSSLIYLAEPNSLMSYLIGENSLYLNIDDCTVDILKTIGWDIPQTAKEIKCDDISENGIGSAYSSHSFSLDGNLNGITAFNWTFSLIDKDGYYKQIKHGTGQTFSIDKISSINNFFINPDGDLEGKIECEYTMNGTKYKASPFHVYLEMKPQIISIDNINKICEGYQYYLTFSVTYAGAESLTIGLEQEYSPLVRTYTIEEPTVAHITTKKMTLYEYTWVNIEVVNKYGRTTESLEFEPIDYYRTEGHASSQEPAAEIFDIDFDYQMDYSREKPRCEGDLSFTISVTAEPELMFLELTRPYIQNYNDEKFLLRAHFDSPSAGTEERHSLYNKTWGTYFRLVAIYKDSNIYRSPMYCTTDFMDPADVEAIMSASGLQEVEAETAATVTVVDRTVHVEADTDYNLIIYSADGKCLHHSHYNSPASVDLSHIPPQMLIIKVESDNFTTTKKITLK